MEKTRYIIWPIAILLLTTISSCDFIASVFKGGVYVGVFLVLIAIAIIVWLVSRTRR